MEGTVLGCVRVGLLGGILIRSAFSIWPGIDCW